MRSGSQKFLIVQAVTLPFTIFDELLDRRFDETCSAIIAVQPDVTTQLGDIAELAAILTTQHDLQLVPFVEDDFGPVVSDAQRNGLAVVSIGWIAGQTRPRICSTAQQ